MTAGWRSRALRAAVFAVVCVLLAALGHVMMSGGEAPAWALAAGVLATGAVGWCLTGRERGMPAIVAAVVAAQALLHEGLSFARPAAGAFVPADSMNMGDPHSMSMGLMRGGSMGMAHMDHLDHVGRSLAGASPSPGMLVAHLAAALLCGLWLAYGEQAVFRITRAAAAYQAARVARARGLTQDQIDALIAQNTSGREAGIFGEPRVNVLKLNLALDDLKPMPPVH